jgi:hypothetical protein
MNYGHLKSTEPIKHDLADTATWHCTYPSITPWHHTCLSRSTDQALHICNTMGQHGQVVLLAHTILSCHGLNLTDILWNFVPWVAWIHRIFLLNSVLYFTTMWLFA